MKEPPSRSGPRPIAPTSLIQKFTAFLNSIFAAPKPATTRTHVSTAAELKSLARNYIASGKTDIAIIACREILARHPDDASTAKQLGDLLAPHDRRQAAINYLGAALINGKQGRARHAYAQLRLAIQLDPELADAHFRLGDYHAGNGDIPEALDLYRTACSIYVRRGMHEQAAQVRDLIEKIEAFYPSTHVRRSSGA